MLRSLIVAGVMAVALPTGAHAVAILPPSLSGNDVPLGTIEIGETRTVLGVLGNVTIGEGVARAINGLLDRFDIDAVLPAGSYSDDHDSFVFTAGGSNVLVNTFEILNGPLFLNDVLDPVASLSGPGGSEQVSLGNAFGAIGVAGQELTLAINGTPEANSLMLYGARIHVTPLPGAVLMFGAGLAALGGWRYRARRQQQVAA
ncbi:MAG: hypothetical protein AAFX81_18360 [Pseudomonadota bacterium]